MTSYQLHQQAVAVYTQQQLSLAQAANHFSQFTAPSTYNTQRTVWDSFHAQQHAWVRDGFFTDLQLNWEQGREWFSHFLIIQRTHRTMTTRTAEAMIGLYKPLNNHIMIRDSEQQEKHWGTSDSAHHLPTTLAISIYMFV